MMRLIFRTLRANQCIIATYSSKISTIRKFKIEAKKSVCSFNENAAYNNIHEFSS